MSLPFASDGGVRGFKHGRAGEIKSHCAIEPAHLLQILFET
ncbi:hypothetical protein WKW50_01010 [Ochrobactrum sp. GPK 3]